MKKNKQPTHILLADNEARLCCDVEGVKSAVQDFLDMGYGDDEIQVFTIESEYKVEIGITIIPK